MGNQGMRRAHQLKHNQKVELPLQLCFVDTEATIFTDEEGVQHQTLMFGYMEIWTVKSWDKRAYVSCETMVFETKEQFWDKLLSFPRSRTKIHVYAHNWQYDATLLGLETVLADQSFTVNKLVTEGCCFFINAMRETRSFAFRDSMNYFPFPLASIAKSLKDAKLPRREDTSDRASMEEYCKRDVEVLRTAIFTLWEFVNEHELGNAQVTLAGQAFSAFRHRFMHHEIMIHEHEPCLELERDSYFGGRVEARFLGTMEGDFYGVDINSMYPTAMLNELMPTSMIYYHKSGTISQLERALERYAVIAKVAIKTDEPLYPKRHNNTLIFPIGTFTTTLCTPELKLALARGDVVGVGPNSAYLQAIIFRDYIDFFYNMRRKYADEGNDAFALLCKLFMNCLYGKFGQTSGAWTDYLKPIMPPPDTDKWRHYDEKNPTGLLLRNIAGVIQSKEKAYESYNSFPAIAAHVTSYARIHLQRLLTMAGEHNVYYMDTDSLVANRRGYDNLYSELHDTSLGKLKLEKVGSTITIRGLKDYTFAGQTKHKGVSAKAVDLGAGKFKQWQFQKWSSAVTSGVHGEVRVSPMIKHLRRIYNKGTVQPDGTVTPLVFTEGEYSS